MTSQFHFSSHKRMAGRAVRIALALGMVLCTTAAAFASGDALPGSTASTASTQAALQLCGKGVLHSYPEGALRPGSPAARAEASAVTYLLGGFLPQLLPEEEPNRLPERNVIDVPYLSQIEPVKAWVGCEGTSLLMGMKGKGYASNVDLKTFLENLPRHSSDPAKGFVGSPFVADRTKKTRTTIYPAKLAEYASQYGTVVDISGSSPEQVQEQVLSGNPVVVYATLYWEQPFYRVYDIEGVPQRLLSNNHAVLVCGYDRGADSYYIADPYNINDPSQEYRYWIDATVFEPIYNARRQAVAVE